ncbi:MAG: ATP-binding protein [Defluviitaleaceae bacterium]|nr:ATP-binding protein [Defluviitaleaceae bacterium]
MRDETKSVKMTKKLTLGMILIAGVCLLVATFFIGTAVMDAVYEDVRASAFFRNTSHAVTINDWLAGPKTVVEHLAETLPLTSPENFHAILEHYLERHDFAVSVWIVFDDDTYYVAGEDLKSFGQHANDGAFCEAEPSGAGRFDVSPEKIITITEFVPDIAGRSGIVGMNVEFELFDQIFREIESLVEAQIDGYLLILCASGSLIIGHDAPVPQGDTASACCGANCRTQCQTHCANRFEYLRDGNMYFLFAPLPAADWTAVFVMPRDEVLAPAYRTIWAVSIVVVFVVVTLMIFTALFFRQVFLRPVELLTTNVREMTDGNGDVKITNTLRNDEIGVLSKAIRMSFRRLHAAQEAERERIQRALDSSPMSVTFFDSDFVMFDCNEAAVRMFGNKNKAELIEFSSAERFYENFPELQPCGTFTRKKIKRCFETAVTDGSCRAEIDRLTTRGEFLPTDTTLVRVDYAGTFMVVMYIRDLRGERKAEEERRRREVAEEAGRAKSRFLARMSHEIRTPITAVLGISEIELQSHDLPENLEEALSKIHTSATMLLGIVNDVLDLSKIDADKAEILPVEYDVPAMINDVTRLHPVFLNGKNVKFCLRVDEYLPAYLYGDSLRIKQILSNLLSNAFKYTETGRVELDWSVEMSTLVITLIDTGLGMTKEQVDLLFNEYMRFHESEYRTIGGTGLGMSIVYSLLRLMNGEISIDSEPGKGTRIFLRIPQESTKKSGVIGKELAQKLEQFDFDAPGKKFAFKPEPMPYGSVLVVDDVPENIYVIKRLLAFYDLNVEVCTSGTDAIEKVASGREYDIIFMDYMMPPPDGVETMLHLRETGYTKPIVVLTATAITGVADGFIQTGFDSFISKPIQTKHLNEVLQRFIRDKYPLEIINAARDNTGDAELVKKLKQIFLRKHKNTFAEITEKINAGDMRSARITVHSLKSVAGLIKEDALTEVAQTIESALAEGNIPENTDVFEAELARVLSSIPPEAAPGFAQNLVKILDKLEPLLKEQNTGALDYLPALSEIPEALIVCRQIEEFNYADALKNLDILKGLL